MLVPLYFRIAEDLKLSGVGAATLIVTLYGAVYNLGSYGAGLAADRFSRKTLLAIGLLGNAAAILAIGISREYSVILAMGVLAGLFGTIFHPSANALATSHYPKSPGMAIGILGIGSGLGFFFGPQIAGWRAETATWQLWHVAQWQKPCVEMAVAGIFVGILFLVLGRDAEAGGPLTPAPDESGFRCAQPLTRSTGRGSKRSGMARLRMDRLLYRHVMQMACVLMFRDFAGVAGLSLAAIYVRNVFGLNVGQAGLFVGVMMLPSVIFNPLAVYLTPGKRRLPGLGMILVAGGIIAATAPVWPLKIDLVVLCGFQTMQLASYAVSDGAMLERVLPEFRGRVVGLFLQIAGTFGALGPWVMGAWTDRLSEAHVRSSYFALWGTVGACMVIAAGAPVLIGRIGPVVSGVKLGEEISPETLGAVP